MVDPSLIDGETTVDELVSRFPATVRVFVRWRMNCVGCEVARFETVADACRNYGLPLDVVLADLRQAAVP